MSEINFEQISLQDFLDSLTYRPGIVVGPDAVATLGDLPKILEGATETILSEDQSLASLSCEDYSKFLDLLRTSHSELAEKYEYSITEGLRKLLPSLDLPYLAKAGWSTCISLTQDLLFEAEMRTYLFPIKYGVPGKFGIHLFGETGRVFIKNDNSKIWHTSFGGGVWMSFIDRMLNLSFDIAFSKELTNYYLRFSMPF